ncbi:oxidoreductase [Halenospora varia]|nr:oxidoreductase [Halenospora varia]
MAQTNTAAFILSLGQPLHIAPLPSPIPGPDELLIQNHALALNPIDNLRQSYGIFNNSYPVILGNDLAGIIISVGSDVTNFQPGQRVLAHALGLRTGENKHGAFQKLTVVNARCVCDIPEGMNFQDACVIPLALSTAVGGLYQTEFLALPLPTSIPTKTGRSILIWGGSSSVGSAAIQLAVASGLEVVTTASERNFEYCKGLGAEAVFDHRSVDVVADLKYALKSEDVVGSFDAIGSPETTMKIAQVLAGKGNILIASVKEGPKDFPDGVTLKQVYGSVAATTKVGQAIYREFLPKALKSGQFKPAPPLEVVGKGLEYLQEGLDRLKKGVSAKKLVVVL